MIRVIVTGAAGRMGGRVLALAKEAGDFRIVGAPERPGTPAIWEEVGGVASVVGTTGLTKEHLAEARRLAAHIACVISPNMSVGVNVLFKVLREVARTLGDDYDVEIVEAHHHFKKDAPSGTALRMAQVVAEALGRDLEQVGIYGRKGIVGERPQAQIGVHTVRAGDIVGEHTVLFGGMGERIEITHRAHSRDNFARGALRAARFVVRAPKGLYDMADVLGLK